MHTPRATQSLLHPPHHGSRCVTGTPSLWGDSPPSHILALLPSAQLGRWGWTKTFELALGEGGLCVCVCVGRRGQVHGCCAHDGPPGQEQFPGTLSIPSPAPQPFSKPLPACALLVTAAEPTQPSPSSPLHGRVSWGLGWGVGGEASCPQGVCVQRGNQAAEQPRWPSTTSCCLSSGPQETLTYPTLPSVVGSQH